MSEENQVPSLPPLPEELKEQLDSYILNNRGDNLDKYNFGVFLRFLLSRGWRIEREEGPGDCVRCNGTGQTIHPCPLCMGTGDRKKGEVCTKNDFQDTWNMKIPAPKEEVPRADAEGQRKEDI